MSRLRTFRFSKMYGPICGVTKAGARDDLKHQMFEELCAAGVIELREDKMVPGAFRPVRGHELEKPDERH